MTTERPNTCQHTVIRMDENGEYCGICGKNIKETDICLPKNKNR